MNLDEAIRDMNNKGIQLMRLVGKAKQVFDFFKVIATTMPLAPEHTWQDEYYDHIHDQYDLIAVTYQLVIPFRIWDRN